MSPVQLLIKPSSGMCNLRCKYCFYHDITSKRDQENYGFMSLETLEVVVQKSLAEAQGSCGFAFQGGEPMLIGLDFYKKLLEFERQYNVNQVEIQHSIQTNGSLVNDQWAEFFAENRFLVGLSIDGIKATHDAYRVDGAGQGTFAVIMSAAALFDKYHTEYNILTVVHGKTAVKTQKIYEFYQKQGFQYLQFIACLDPIGEKPGAREYSLTPELYGDFLITLFDLWFLDLKKGKQPYIRQFENYIAMLVGYPPEACEQRGTCSIQNVVEADGSVYPCDFYVMEDYRIGNFHEDDLYTMHERGIQSGFLTQGMVDEACTQCRFYPICRGGCRRHRTNGRNYFCESYQLFFEHALPKMREIAKRISQP